MKWRTVWTIAKKDIVDAIRNSYILFGLVLPLGIGLLFRVVFPSEASVNAMTVAVYDADHSRLVEQLRALPEVRLLEVSSVEEVSAHVRNEAVGGLVLPEGFDAAVVAGQKPELGVHLNGRKGGGEKMAFQLSLIHI